LAAGAQRSVAAFSAVQPGCRNAGFALVHASAVDCGLAAIRVAERDGASNVGDGDCR
jgi:hypothetical protein